MEGHSGKPLYLSIAPRFITNRGVFVACGTFVLLACFRYNGGRKNKGGEVNEINF